MEEIIRLGREVAISSWIGSPYKVRNSGNFNMRHGLL